METNTHEIESRSHVISKQLRWVTQFKNCLENIIRYRKNHNTLLKEDMLDYFKKG